MLLFCWYRHFEDYIIGAPPMQVSIYGACVCVSLRVYQCVVEGLNYMTSMDDTEQKASLISN